MMNAMDLSRETLRLGLPKVHKFRFRPKGFRADKHRQQGSLPQNISLTWWPLLSPVPRPLANSISHAGLARTLECATRCRFEATSKFQCYWDDFLGYHILSSKCVLSCITFIHGFHLKLIHCESSYLFLQRSMFLTGGSLACDCLSLQCVHNPSNMLLPSMTNSWRKDDPCIAPFPSDDSLSWCRTPPSSPVLSPQKDHTLGEISSSPSYAMPTVDEQLVKHAKKLSEAPSPAHEAYLRKKTLSVDSSPLHQVYSADDDPATFAASNTGEDENWVGTGLALTCDDCRLANRLSPPGIKRLEDFGKWRCGESSAMNREKIEFKNSVASIKEQASQRTGYDDNEKRGKMIPKDQIGYQNATLASANSGHEDNSLSSRSSSADTLLAERRRWRRDIPPALFLKARDKGENPTWSQPTPEASPPVSPTLSESSLSSTTPLFTKRFHTMSLSRHSNAPEPQPLIKSRQTSIHSRRISSPLESSSSIDALIRPSRLSSNSNTTPSKYTNLSPTPSPPSSSTKATKFKSWPKRHHFAKAREAEKGVLEIEALDLKSQFSDDEDDDACKRLGKIFGNCFGARKS